MLRLKIVGRREEPGATIAPGAPGMPQTSIPATSSVILAQSVDAQGELVSPQLIAIPVVSLEDAAQYTTGSVYEMGAGSF